ncbi:MAG: TlpA family protein disulfide reductase [Lewinella sp.]|uniref:TlpA family protein disulfide reductase n=1 Tax=Lewinella sp. TaxID=2004506 RepID=UPI003D6B03B8
MKFAPILLAAVVLLTLTTCLRMENAYTKIPPGVWRAVLQLDPSAVSPNPKGEYREDKLGLTFDEVTNGELPFNFEVEYTDDTTFQIVFLNGEERIVVKDISFGRSKSRAKDSIRINFPIYDTYIVGLYEEGLIEGEYVVNYRENYSIPFIAHFGENHRFTKIPKAPALNLSGIWEVTFGPGGDESAAFAGIGEFVQKDNQLSGTFRTETGDYRYLEGEVSGTKAYLSVFDGAHAFLFEAQIDADAEAMVGSFRSGKHYRTIWQAHRNSEATLESPYELTKVIEAGNPVDFTFPNTKGEAISLSDEAFAGKAKLIQIMGTWCPNCKDETQFLLDYFANNTHPDLQVISIGFERYREEERALAALSRYQERNEIPYPVLWGGYYDKEEASRALPMLNKIISYPTLLFIDKENRVRKIHTGFDGPATSRFKAFQDEFEQSIQQLLSES